VLRLGKPGVRGETGSRTPTTERFLTYFSSSSSSLRGNYSFNFFQMSELYLKRLQRVYWLPIRHR
jgi:hypothetical protein